MIKVNFKQPKYIFPAVIFIPLCALVYFVMQTFGGGGEPEQAVATDRINTELPEAHAEEAGDKMYEMSRRFGDEDAFTAAAVEEIKDLYEKIDELYQMVRKTFDERDITMFEKINDLKVSIAILKNADCDAHIERLNRGECTPARGAIFLQLLGNMERVSGHMKNISNSVMKSSARYQKLLKTQGSAENADASVTQ